MHWSARIIFKVLLSIFAEVTSSFRSFIVSYCSLTQVLSYVASLDELSKYGTCSSK